MYGALRGRLPAKLLALFKIPNPTCDTTVQRLASGQMLSQVTSRRKSDVHSVVTMYVTGMGTGWFRVSL